MRNVDLKVEEIEGILYLLINDLVKTNNELVLETGLPKETLRIFKKSISDILEKSGVDEILFKVDIGDQLKNEDLKPYKWRLLEYNEPKYEKKLAEFRKKYDLEPKREYDQFFATVNTSVSKVKAMVDKGQISGKNIALLGDDDLVSISINLAGLRPREIIVYDVDRDILNTIDKVAEQEGYTNIKTKIYDVRKTIEKTEYGKFDVVSTDPPYTKSGIKLFLNRAVQLLKPSETFEGKYIYLFYGNSFKSPEKTIKIQEVISEFGLVIEDKIDKFARYHGAESIGSTSSMYILKTTPFTRTLDESLLSQSIYTFEDQAEENFPYVDHYVFKLNKVPKDLLTSKANLQKSVSKLCEKHRLKVVDKKITKFKGGGLTLTYVLSNSNLSVHTWPEHDALHFDLVTCSPIYNKENLPVSLADIFKTNSIEVVKVE